jgi:RNA polymerase sigma-70 factor (ECF subfamily)
MKSDENTQTLLVRWRQGSRDAGDRLLHRYVPELAGFFGRRSVGNAEELVQRTLLACTQGIGRFEGRSTFRSYLFGIAHNQYRMYLRSEAYAGRESVTVSTRPEDSPSRLAAVRQEQVILILAMKRVDPDFAVVLKMYYLDDRPLEEISAELGIPVGTVKSRLARGRASLKEEVARVRLRDDVRAEALSEISRLFSKGVD